MQVGVGTKSKENVGKLLIKPSRTVLPFDTAHAFCTSRDSLPKTRVS